MTSQEIERDLDMAIAKLTDAKSRVPALSGLHDLGELRKMCGAVGDFCSGISTLPVLELPSEAEDEHETASQKSEVAGMHADEAKEAISRMRSVEKLSHIAENDSRVTVQEAAIKRLKELA